MNTNLKSARLSSLWGNEMRKDKIYNSRKFNANQYRTEKAKSIRKFQFRGSSSQSTLNQNVELLTQKSKFTGKS